jgi:S-DNA-T family DNA segregation ATPase FtsK/SpoIIIE
VVVIVDKAHTFLNESKGTDVESKRLDALARETARGETSTPRKSAP